MTYYVSGLPYSEELCHFGILGQKWGIRRFQNPDGSYTPAGRKRYGIGDDSFYKEGNNKIVEKSDGSKVIKSGFMFNRVGQANFDPNQSGALYASTNKNDTARYIKSLGPTLLGKITGSSHTHVQHIKVKNDLKVPSENQLADATVKFLSKDSGFLKAFNDSIYAWSFYDNKLTNQDLLNISKNPYGKESKKLAFVVSTMLGNENYAEQSKKYFNHLRNLGYDAIPDLNDLYGGTSESPMIIINTDKLKIDSTTLITKDVMKTGKQWAKKAGKLKVNDIIK